MVNAIQEHQAELVRLCKKYRVRKFEAFGSAATGEGFDPETSDLDFLVEYESLESDGYARAYFGLLEELQKLFNRPVDLVMTRAIRNNGRRWSGGWDHCYCLYICSCPDTLCPGLVYIWPLQGVPGICV